MPHQTYLFLGVTVTAHGPQVLQGPPQEDNEEPPEESDHGGSEESPPHPLTAAVTGHVGRERDDHIHLGSIDRGVRAVFLSFLCHHGLLVTCRPLRANKSTRMESERDSGASGSSSQRPLMPQRLRHV